MGSHADLSNPTADFAYVVKFSRSDSSQSGCMVAFRGPDNTANNRETTRHELADWEVKVCDGCKVFLGYKRIWQQLKPGVIEKLNSLGCKSGDHVYLTGHSLGAGVATLAMYSLRGEEDFDVQLSYNFESPKVGNPAFAHSFSRLFGRSASLFRITHGNDAIPRFPSVDGYTHVGFQVWYPGDSPGVYTICGNSSTDQTCGNDGVEDSELCPLAKSDCRSESCKEMCKFPPVGGPHCQSPLAPARNFCSFAGDSSKFLQEYFKRSCIWGRAALTLDSCFTKSAMWSPLDMDLLRYPFSIETTITNCQARCQQISGCAHFSYSVVDGACHVTNSGASQLAGSIGYIAGPRQCARSDIESKYLRFSITEIGNAGSTITAGFAVATALVAAVVFGRRCHQCRFSAEDALMGTRRQGAYGPVRIVQ